MKGEWCYFKSYFTPEQCARIVSIAKSREPSEAQIGTDAGIKADDSFRRSSIWFVNKGDTELDYMFDELWRLAIWANRDWFDVHISKIDYYQIAEYDGERQGEYKTHHDIFYMNGDPYYHRKLSCVIQLTDPAEYKGGDLTFEHVTQLPERRGDAAAGHGDLLPLVCASCGAACNRREAALDCGVVRRT